MNAFAGFPPEGLKFLRDLTRHNDREWFQARKPVYEEHVKQPMLALAAALNGDFAKFAPEYVTDPAKAVFRIYRDTRFSKDKTPYKTHIAAQFGRRDLAKMGGAGFYFSIAPEHVEAGGGAYMPSPETLRALRARIAENHERFQALVDAKRLRQLLGDLKGGRLTRVPKGYPPDHPAADLVRYKSLYFFIELPGELALEPELQPELAKRFKALTPFLEFLNEPLAKLVASPSEPKWSK